MLLNSNNFIQLNEDPAKAMEGKVQRMLHKIEQVYLFKSTKIYIYLVHLQVHFAVQQSVLKFKLMTV